MPSTEPIPRCSDAGALINAPDLMGDTPLHVAAAAANPAAVRALLRAGGDPRIRNSSGMRPIDMCGQFGQVTERSVECARLLVVGESPFDVETQLPNAEPPPSTFSAAHTTAATSRDCCCRRRRAASPCALC